MMAGYPETVKITKTVPVSDHETLAAWLNLKLDSWYERHPTMDDDKLNVGEKVVALIVQAGFELKPPGAVRAMGQCL